MLEKQHQSRSVFALDTREALRLILSWRNEPLFPETTLRLTARLQIMLDSQLKMLVQS